LRIRGDASLFEPADDPSEHVAVVAELRAKYPQYDSQAIEARPVVRFAIDRVVTWGTLDGIARD